MCRIRRLKVGRNRADIDLIGTFIRRISKVIALLYEELQVYRYACLFILDPRQDVRSTQETSKNITGRGFDWPFN
jgi:hypothetical protein